MAIKYIQGLEALKRDYAAMPADLRRQALKRTAYAGAVTVRPAVHARTPISPKPYRRKGRLTVPGLLRASLMIVAGRSSPVEARYILKFRSSKAYYDRWVERGHRIVARSQRIGTRNGKALNKTTLRKRRASSSGFVQGRWMLGKGYAATQQQALSAMLLAAETGARQARFLTMRRA